MYSQSTNKARSSVFMIEIPKAKPSTRSNTEENEKNDDKNIENTKENEKEKTENDQQEKERKEKEKKEKEFEKISLKYNSPYMLEACRHLGYNPEDFRKKSHFFFFFFFLKKIIVSGLWSISKKKILIYQRNYLK